MSSVRLNWLPAFCLLFLLLACGSNPKSIEPTANNLPEFRESAYRMNPGDVVEILVYREADLSGNYRIEQSGTINFPLLGRIPAANETTDQLERRIAKGLSQGYLVDPDVRASVVGYQPIYVGGEVKRPGEYPYKPGLTAQQAVTLAGGLTRFAADKYYLRRRGENEGETIRITSDTVLAPGDSITIGERLF